MQQWEARVHRLEAASPNDISGIEQAVQAGRLDPAHVLAVLGKTEGNGCVNDFTRGYATQTLKQAFGKWLKLEPTEVEKQIVLVMSGGTEGSLSPHWLVFERVAATSPAPSPATKRLALGAATTAALLPEEIGREAHIAQVRDAVLRAMAQAGIDDPQDVHYVQVKCPLLTKARIEAAATRGQSTCTQDTYVSMAYSRGASALGVALALGETGNATAASLEKVVCQDHRVFSTRASTSSGIELMDNQVLVLGNSSAWGGNLQVAHSVMQDAIDLGAFQDVLQTLGLPTARQLGEADRARLIAVLAKAEPSRTGLIRGARHTMLDDSDIQATRHARAVVGGVLSALAGDTRLFVSGGAEHQGPDGGGPVAAIAVVKP